MRYLVTTNCYEPFYTEWFDPENNFNKAAEMVVFDLYEKKYMTDGKTWHVIPEDNL
jgi:hypothetical protein